MGDRVMRKWKQESDSPRGRCTHCGEKLEYVIGRGWETYSITCEMFPSSGHIEGDGYQTQDLVESDMNEYECPNCGGYFLRSELREIWGIE